jgi:lipopolysaccharide/colanic/teichoic acid biosynthesis glycosyltransferase
MVELDIAWVERHSIGLYLSIIARTPRILLKRSEAA